MMQELHKSVLFQRFELEHLQDLLERIPSRIIHVEKGEFVIKEGDLVNEIGIVLEGELCESKYFADGSEQLMQKLQPHYMVGAEAALSAKKSSPYHVYATKESQIFLMPISVMETDRVLSQEDRLILYQNCVEFLANDNIRRYKKVELLSVKGAREKIYRYLCFQRDKFHNNKFKVGFDREQMANYLGMNRSVLSHTLKQMENEGLLKVSKNRFELTEKFDEALKE